MYFEAAHPGYVRNHGDSESSLFGRIMTKVDQFESMFRSASREVYVYERVNIESVLVVTDLDEAEARSFGDQVRQFLTVISDDEKVRWRNVGGSEFQTAGELMALVESAAPDIICTYRNLHSSAWKWSYSLGTHVDLLTQHTRIPVMLLPHPKAERSAGHAFENADMVMAITSHLTGDNVLVNYAVRFTEEHQTLWLTHVEDEATFDRYMDVISKIPTIETDEARKNFLERLMKEPEDYIDDCVDVLQAAGVRVQVRQLVTFGHHLPEYERLIEQHEIDLLVMNTKDEHQLAMNGMAYALAVELRQIPLLML
jgi:nucleotide-binding universal stress UspA family protein